MAVGEGNSFAVVVFRDEAGWQAGLLPERLVEDLDGLLAALRQQPGQGAIALVNTADEFFVAVRHDGGGDRLLLSDVTAAVAWDLARQVVARLDVDVPGEDDIDEVLPAGDLAIFADLGLDEMELGTVLANPDDDYADVQLSQLAHRLGFADAYERVVEAAAR